jgi:hypothetical protein
MVEQADIHPGRLWKQMADADKLRAADAFWRDPEGAPQQIEAMALLAQRLKARPRYIQGLAIEKRAHHLAHYVGMPDLLAARLLVSYHLAHQRPMMAAFLDAVGIPHEDGLITSEVEGGSVAADKVAAGVKALEASFPAEDVQRYFATLLAQDPDTWAGLEAHLKS